MLDLQEKRAYTIKLKNIDYFYNGFFLKYEEGFYYFTKTIFDFSTNKWLNEFQVDAIFSKEEIGLIYLMSRYDDEIYEDKEIGYKDGFDSHTLIDMEQKLADEKLLLIN